ncbi:MAG: transketolase family protein [Candidatus Woesearchaeota archaeon]
MVSEAIRDGIGKGMLELGKQKDVVVLVADLSSSTRASDFAKKYPKRFYQVGICEQNMAGVAGGMALLGKVPIINSFAVFSPGRNWEQIRTSICYSNVHVIIHGSHAGLTVGEDGATHQALEDIAITRVLPNMTVIVPCDAVQAKQAMIAAYGCKGAVYIRSSRAKVPVVTKETDSFVIGKANVLKRGKDVSIFANGVLVSEALHAIDILKKEGIQAELINVHTVKPLDMKQIMNSLEKTKCGVVCEEHQKHGGLFGAISECVVSQVPYPLESVSVQDTFGESGPASALLKKYALDSTAIVSKVREVLKRKIRLM